MEIYFDHSGHRWAFRCFKNTIRIWKKSELALVINM